MKPRIEGVMYWSSIKAKFKYAELGMLFSGTELMLLDANAEISMTSKGEILKTVSSQWTGHRITE